MLSRPVDAQAWLARLSPEERRYWDAKYRELQLDANGIQFHAVAMDSAGRPIPVMSTDPATPLFLQPVTASRRAEAANDLEMLLLPYPLGLSVPELGPLVANDINADTRCRRVFVRTCTIRRAWCGDAR